MWRNSLNTQMEPFCFLARGYVELNVSCWAADSASNSWSHSGVAHEKAVTDMSCSLTRSLALSLVHASTTPLMTLPTLCQTRTAPNWRFLNSFLRNTVGQKFTPLVTDSDLHNCVHVTRYWSNFTYSHKVSAPPSLVTSRQLWQLKFCMYLLVCPMRAIFAANLTLFRFFS